VLRKKKNREHFAHQGKVVVGLKERLQHALPGLKKDTWKEIAC
jgi:hypothetical protein